jgi:F-type H+-transporting ATPase subunit epsilon
MSVLTLEIVTPTRQVLKDQVEEVYAPGALGEFGILPQHTPFLTLLGVGTLTYVKDRKKTRFVIQGGFAEVSRDHMIILTEACMRAEEIDLDRARKTLAETEKILLEMDASSPEYPETRERARRAAAEVAVAESADI